MNIDGANVVFFFLNDKENDYDEKSSLMETNGFYFSNFLKKDDLFLSFVHNVERRLSVFKSCTIN
jgi:hypothetical protein